MKISNVQLILLALFTCYTLSSNAQTYDLNSYDFRYQHYRGLTFDFDLSNNASQNFTSTQDQIASDSFFYNNGSGRLNFFVSPTYFSFKNTDRIQQNVQANLGIGYNGSVFKRKSSYDLIGSGDKAFRLNFNYDNETRIYNENKFKYYGLRANADYNRSNSIGTIVDVDDNIQNRTDLRGQASVSVGFGSGRINIVSDAVQAMFILEDLKKIGLKSKTNEELEGIAKGITKIRNARYLDFRIGYRQQLKMLDSVLQANNVNAESAIDYFTIISDNWLYANRRNRISGKRWTHFANVGYEQFTNNSYGEYSLINSPSYVLNDATLSSPTLSLNTAFTNYKQKSLYIQQGLAVNVATGVSYEDRRFAVITGSMPVDRDTVTLSDPAKNTSWVSSITARLEHLYQANTRNLMVLAIAPGLRYTQTLPKYSADQFGNQITTLNPSLQLSAVYYYWFSPNLNINAAGRIGTSYLSARNNADIGNVYSQSSVMNYNLSVGINYQLY